jgi:NodT family efflux transporter outer membrane factor (OMF) lipoprotein
VRQAQSQYYPTLTVSPAVTRSRQLYTPSPGSPATPYTVTEFSLPFDATWEADFWGRIRNTVKAGTLEAQASLADLGNVRLAQQAELAVAYFQIQAQDAQAELLTSAVADYQEALTLVRIQEGAGMASGQDVEQALTLLTATRAQATDLGILRAQLEHAIATLTGRTASAFSLPAHALNAQPLLIPPGLPAELLERRPDIAAAERRVAEANAQIGVARAAYFPTALLGASAGYQHATLGGLVSSPNLLWSVGATLAGTLFDGGRRRAVTEQAKATYLGTVATYRQTVLGAFQDVEDNLSTLRLLAVERGQQDEAVASAQRYLALALSRYDAGLDLYLEVITARTALLSNQRVAAGLRMQQMVASVQLIKALGGGWRAEPAGS